MKIKDKIIVTKKEDKPLDLLDARGYQVKLKCLDENAADTKINIRYLGAVKSESKTREYRNDKYTVSYIENATANGEYTKTVRDPGITISGLKLIIGTDRDTDLDITLCGELNDRIHLSAGEDVEKIYDVTALCREEKEKLTQIHRILYKLLSEIDRVCMENDIQYFLVFGGLLGYLRHGEIIPWDDDVDIAMTRENFEKFKRIANEKLSDGFKCIDAGELGEDAFLDFLCRVFYMKENVEYDALDKVKGKVPEEYLNKIPMDIYILDKASDLKFLHKIHMFLIRAVYGLGMGHRAYLNMDEYGNSGFVTQKGIMILSRIGSKMKLKTIMRLHDRVSMLYSKRKTRNYFMSNGYLPFIHTKYVCRWFEGTKRVKLGNVTTNVPCRYRLYLKRAYYDYYHLPPVEKRIPGHMCLKMKKGK